MEQLFAFLDPLIVGVSRGQQLELEPPKSKHLDPLLQRIDAPLRCQHDRESIPKNVKK